MKPFVTPFVFILLLVGICSCRKAEEAQSVPSGTGDLPASGKYCKLWQLESVETCTANGKLDSMVAKSKDSVVIVRANGHISGLLLFSKSFPDKTYSRVGQTDFIYQGNSIIQRFALEDIGVGDTITLGATGHIVRRSHYKPEDCQYSEYDVTNYVFDASGQFQYALNEHYSDGKFRSKDTSRYTFNNGDYTPPYVKTASYDASRSIPANFISYGELRDAGTYTYRNKHLLSSISASGQPQLGQFSYKFDSSGNLVQVVSLFPFEPHNMSVTEDYHYVCTEE